eukprot:TRINITY_DN4182_c0_g1_i1.p1 TRINITY_DN4182_c0_g1~~TRINITY_DN4182_c0_g1_i1.p1  ORF type:complete len:349 (-),score=32.98 TRINITY_DN4182_c0_g1_i1:304-1350(-)
MRLSLCNKRFKYLPQLAILAACCFMVFNSGPTFNETRAPSSDVPKPSQASLEPPKAENIHPIALSNMRIMFLGDSLTRYQYLNLAFALEHNDWAEPESLLCCERKTTSWTDFYAQTNKLLKGQEVCDCFRDSCCGGFTVFENRSYYNRRHNISLWYVQWFGEVAHPHGHVPLWDYGNPTDIPQDSCRPFNCSRTDDAWMLATDQFVTRFVEKINPDFVILNSGYHTNYSEARYLSIHDRLRQSISQLTKKGYQTKFIWKATTPYLLQAGINSTLVRNPDLFVDKWLEDGLQIFDPYVVLKRLWDSFSSPIVAAHRMYWDLKHFNCWVYDHLNHALVHRMKPKHLVNDT